MNLNELTKEAEKICEKVKNDEVLGDYFIHNNPWANRPWKEFNYWNGWYALSKLWRPRKILEIGTGFGLSTIAITKGAGKTLELIISIDLGNFMGKDNIHFSSIGIDEYRKRNNLSFETYFFEANTQPSPYSDNNDKTTNVRYWGNIEILVQLLTDNRFNLVLIDGKHTKEGLYEDLRSFFPYGSTNSLFICDDIQHSDASRSFSRFVNMKQITDYYVWDFLTCNEEYAGSKKRIQGLIPKC